MAWTVTANGARSRAAGVSPAAAYQHALAAGLDRAFLMAAGPSVLILVTAVVAIRRRHGGLSAPDVPHDMVA